jgi:predicted nucleotidyltransferase
MDQIGDFCRRHKVVRMALFGSVLRDDFRPDSDVDVLVEFEPTAHVSLFDIGGMTVELSAIMGRCVDLRTPEDLSKYFRVAVMREARSLYAA